jgi:hypothetical protein
MPKSPAHLFLLAPNPGGQLPLRMSHDEPPVLLASKRCKPVRESNTH